MSTLTSTAPTIDIVPIVPSNTAPLPKPARMIRCKPVSGTAGTVCIQTADGEQRTTEIAVGEKLSIGVLRVFATGTTATGLEAHI